MQYCERGVTFRSTSGSSPHKRGTTPPQNRHILAMTAMDFSISQPQPAHPGGFFWTVDRSRRVPVILSLVSRLSGVVVIAGSSSEAQEVSKTLTLRGVPVKLAADPSNDRDVKAFSAESKGALVATADVIEKHGPIRSPLTIHLRPPFSPRSYAKRVKSALSAVHVTFVTPEDEQRAGELRSSFSHSAAPAHDDGVELTDLVDLTRSPDIAVIEQPRRRFAFR